MSTSLRSPQDAFSLVEVTIAFGIVAFAVVVVIGLLPVGLSASQEGSAEEAATEILSAAAADIGNAAPSGRNSPLYGIPLNAPADVFFSPGPILSISTSNSDFRLSISPRTSANPALRILHLTVSWPPHVVTPTGSVETLVMRANPSQR